MSETISVEASDGEEVVIHPIELAEPSPVPVPQTDDLPAATEEVGPSTSGPTMKAVRPCLAWTDSGWIEGAPPLRAHHRSDQRDYYSRGNSDDHLRGSRLDGRFASERRSLPVRLLPEN